MLKEKLMKIFKENKYTKGVNQKILVSLCEKIDKEVNEETEKSVKIKLNEETKKIKEKLSAKYKKDNEIFMESYKKVFNSNIEKKLDIVLNTLYKELKEEIRIENDKLVDEYVSETLKNEAKKLKEDVIDFSKKIAEEFKIKEKALIREYIEKQKENYFAEKVLSTIKSLNWDKKIENNEIVKKLAEENNILKKKYKDIKHKSLKIYKEKIFNENFNGLSDVKKEEIKKYIEEKAKPKNIKEYKDVCKKLLESRTIKKTVSNKEVNDIPKMERPSWEQFV